MLLKVGTLSFLLFYHYYYYYHNNEAIILPTLLEGAFHSLEEKWQADVYWPDTHPGFIMSFHYSDWKDIPSDSLQMIAECQALLEYIYLLAPHCSHPFSQWGVAGLFE